MELCPKCGFMCAERNHYNGLLICFNNDCDYEEIDFVDFVDLGEDTLKRDGVECLLHILNLIISKYSMWMSEKDKKKVIEQRDVLQKIIDNTEEKKE
jgi:hypothetical protein